MIEDPTFGKPPAPPPPKKKRLTPSQVAWLFVCQPEKLTERQQKQVEIVCQAGTDLQQVYEWAQDFIRMVAERKAESFEPWLQRIEQSTIPALKGFAKGLRRDDAAVVAGLTYSWSHDYVA